MFEVLGFVLTLLSVGFILLTFPLTAWMCAQVTDTNTEVDLSFPRTRRSYTQYMLLVFVGFWVL